MSGRLRLPAIYGMWLMSVCLFLLVSRRADIAHGIVAMLLPLATGAYRYAHEARPYGLMLGCSALALVSWQGAAEEEDRGLSLGGSRLGPGRRRRLSLFRCVPGLTPVHRGVVRTHYAQTGWTRRCGWHFSVGLSPLAMWWPLIEGAKENAGVFWAQPTWDFALLFYESMLAPALPAAILGLGTLLVTIARRPTQELKAGRLADWPRHELAAYLGFIALPVVGAMVAELALGGVAPRYLITAIVGLCATIPLVVYRIMGGAAFVVRAIAVSLSLCIIATQIAGIRLCA